MLSQWYHEFKFFLKQYVFLVSIRLKYQQLKNSMGCITCYDFGYLTLK